MTTDRSKGSMSAVAALVAMAVFLLSSPAALYQSFTWIGEMLPHWLVHRGTPIPPALANVIALCFFLVALIGRPMCAIAIVLDLVLLFLRGAPVWLRVLASAFVVFAVFGTLLVEIQARYVRQ